MAFDKEHGGIDHRQREIDNLRRREADAREQADMPMFHGNMVLYGLGIPGILWVFGNTNILGSDLKFNGPSEWTNPFEQISNQLEGKFDSVAEQVALGAPAAILGTVLVFAAVMWLLIQPHRYRREGGERVLRGY